MLNIQIITVKHTDQRYPTCGDWFWQGDKLCIYISELGDWRYEAAVALHEMAEAILCSHTHVSQEDVDDFDKKFEETRAEGNTDEPGDHPLAPYRDQHFIATNLERQFAHELDIDWSEYEAAINNL